VEGVTPVYPTAMEIWKNSDCPPAIPGIAMSGACFGGAFRQIFADSCSPLENWGSQENQGSCGSAATLFTHL